MSWRDGVLIAAVSLAALAAVLTYCEVRTAQESIRRLGPRNGAVRAPSEVETMQTMTSKWKDKDGLEHSVTTVREPDETTTAFAARHKAAVEALKALYPPA